MTPALRGRGENLLHGHGKRRVQHGARPDQKMTVFLFCRDDVSIQNDHIRDVDWSSHPDFSVSGSPAVSSTTSSTAPATAWLSSPAASRKRRPKSGSAPCREGGCQYV